MLILLLEGFRVVLFLIVVMFMISYNPLNWPSKERKEKLTWLSCVSNTHSMLPTCRFRWVHSEAQLGNSLTKGRTKELEMFYQMAHRWRLVSDDSMMSARRRRQCGLQALQQQPQQARMGPEAQEATWGVLWFVGFCVVCCFCRSFWKIQSNKRVEVMQVIPLVARQVSLCLLRSLGTRGKRGLCDFSVNTVDPYSFPVC